MSKALFHSLLDRFLNGRIICMLSVLLTITNCFPVVGAIVVGTIGGFAVSAAFMFVPGLCFAMTKRVGTKRTYPEGTTILQKYLRYELWPDVKLTWRRLVEAFIHPFTGAAFIITTVSIWAVMVGMVPLDFAAIILAWLLLMFIAEQIVSAMLSEPREKVQN